MRKIRFNIVKNDSNLRQVTIDGNVAGVAMIQDPRNGYRGLGERRIVFEPWGPLWGGKQRIFQKLADLREWLERAEA
jgi:hypothetical protein